MDHQEARIFYFDPEHVEGTTVKAPSAASHHKHPKGSEGVREHPNDANVFFHDIVQALADVEKILVVGPATAKLEFIKYAHHHSRALESKIIGVETVDHPTAGQLVAYAKDYFRRLESAAR